ncbi:hypothetical protein Ancab_030431 [Ancistrocladus abbreviatus]
MTSTLYFFLLFFPLLSLQSQAANTTASTKYTLPVIKDTAKHQYFTTFEIGTPPLRVFLIVDLANQWSWMSCSLYGYNSSTSHQSSCHTTLCATYGGPHRPWCIDTDMCGVYAYTPWTWTEYAVGVYEDTLLLSSIDHPQSPSKLAKVPLPHFPIACADTQPLKGISRYTKGYNGAVYFGGGPYYFPPSNLDMSKFLVYTPLITNPNSTAPSSVFERGDPSYEYFFKVRSIKINKFPVHFNTSLLSIDKNGNGGTKISTLSPYTTLQSDIFRATVEDFVEQAAKMGITRVASVPPFGACFSTRGIASTETGLSMPIIDLIMEGKSDLLHGKSARWRIYGANSMVRIGRNVTCLAVVDGGVAPRTAVVVGGYQLENNVVEFDLEGYKIGVSSSLLRWNTTCSQFKGY